MSDSPQNILREAADRLIQTAEHLGRVASLSSATSTASSLPATNSVVAVSGNPANSAPPIPSSAASEHARLFGYRPPVAGNVRSRGTSTRGRAKGRTNSSAPYHLHQRGLTWSRSFVCLAYSNQTHPPTPSERVVLALNNLGEKRIEFPRDGKYITPQPLNSLIVHTSACNQTASPRTPLWMLQHVHGHFNILTSPVRPKPWGESIFCHCLLEKAKNSSCGIRCSNPKIYSKSCVSVISPWNWKIDESILCCLFINSFSKSIQVFFF